MNFSVEQFHELDADFDLPADRVRNWKTVPGARQAADEELVRVLGIAPEPVRGIAPPPGAKSLEVAVRNGQPARTRPVPLATRGGAKTNALVKLEGGGVAYLARARRNGDRALRGSPCGLAAGKRGCQPDHGPGPFLRSVDLRENVSAANAHLSGRQTDLDCSARMASPALRRAETPCPARGS